MVSSKAGPRRPAAGARQRAPLPRVRLLHALRVADPAGADPMTVFGVAGVMLQLVIVIGLAPLLTGTMRQLRAAMEGRAGAAFQSWHVGDDVWSGGVL